MMDYYNTPAQLSPSVFYDTAHEQQLEASRANKKNLLKKMKANVKKYLKMVKDVQEMNNVVSEAKTKCFWDSEVMKAYKEWDQTLQNNPICVPPDPVQEHETAASPVHQEPETPACEVHHEVTTHEEGREDEEAQKVISTVLVQMASEGILQPDDGGVTDTLIANIQTVEPGLDSEDKARLEPVDFPLTGFCNEVVFPSGQIAFPVTLSDGKHSRTVTVNFMVMPATSRHDVLLGRRSQREFSMITSIPHAACGFPTETGVAILYSIKEVMSVDDEPPAKVVKS
ncbi:uncharacterized protein LOC110913598 [Helianthus annuus]|uniref:uncharacterized protein LOC110913598 n=1 Tax=Helianthus annuus TaxID=4232 RepID=UPI0016530281|nr:uncharacterized protein LOC110913598 [Helianthus annuus]